MCEHTLCASGNKKIQCCSDLVRIARDQLCLHSAWSSLKTALICSGSNCPRVTDHKMIQLHSLHIPSAGSMAGRTRWPGAQVLQLKSWSSS